MNNKFIRFLIIINGILIPIFILTLIGFIISDYFKRDYINSEIKENLEIEYIIKQTSLRKVYNSDIFYVLSFKKEKSMEALFPEDHLKIRELPDYTVNVTFFDKEFNKIGKLLTENGSITHLGLLNFYNSENNSPKHIIYTIGPKDTNDDNIIDYKDNHFLYISDLDGKNLTLVLDKKVKEYKYINDFTELLVTYYDQNNMLNLGIYNIKNKSFLKKSKLN
ncbi:MAG: hypothetical protein ABFS12_17755 [Bacteroidota bacterium]